MANAKELKALITLSGKLDPSLQKALLDAAGKTRKYAGEMGLASLAGSKMKAGLSSLAGTMASKLPEGAQKLLALTQKSDLARASFISLKNAGSTMTKVVGVGLASLAAAGIMGLSAIAKTGLETASNLAEVQNVVDVTYGASAARINQWSRELLQSHGLAELSAKKYSSTIGAMLKSAGVSGDEMMVMSQNLTMLTGDMASFYNLGADEMFAKIRAGISGETEPLKQLGINMSAANLEAYALSQGIDAGYSSMSQGEQMILRYNYLLEAAADAQGDFSRTSDSLANQQKLLKENFTQISAKIMTGVMPAAAKLAQGMNEAMSSMDTEALGGFAVQIADLALELMPIAMEILPVIQNLITTLLPPLIEIIRIVLPPLTKFLNLIISVLGKLAGAGAKAISAVAGFFTGKGGEPSGSSVPAFARGGFADRPSIFGEAGLEAAIPIKPGDPRSLALLRKTAELLGVGFGSLTRHPSLSGGPGPEAAVPTKRGDSRGLALLQKTAKLLGVSFGGNIHLTYAPVINGGDAEAIREFTRGHARDMLSMVREEENKRRRVSFAPPEPAPV